MLKTVRVVPIKEDGTKVAALLRGEVNLINQVPPQYIPRMKEDERTKVATDKGTRIFHLGFTHRIESPLNDVRVRRAIAHAINRDLIVKHVVEGYGTVANSPLHDWTEGYDPKAPSKYPYDPKKAKQLLKEAGNGDGLEITFYSPAGRYTKDKEVAEAITGFLQQVGIKVKYQPLTWSRFVQVFRAQKEPNAEPFMYYIGYGNGNGDSDRALNAIAGCKGAWSGYCSKDLDKKLNEALGTVDIKERERIFREIVAMMVEDVSHVFLWQEDAIYGMSQDVTWDVRNDDRVYAWEIDRKK
jgi:peptide/nickel transport system substrate-binding protein